MRAPSKAELRSQRFKFQRGGRVHRPRRFSEAFFDFADLPHSSLNDAPFAKSEPSQHPLPPSVDAGKPFVAMNGVPVQGVWQEARAADGRVYYYNTATKATQWTKPETLMTPQEVIPNVCPSCGRAAYNILTARSNESAMERVHCSQWPQVLEPHGDEAKRVGNAQGIQRCNRDECAAAQTCCSVCSRARVEVKRETRC